MISYLLKVENNSCILHWNSDGMDIIQGIVMNSSEAYTLVSASVWNRGMVADIMLL